MCSLERISLHFQKRIILGGRGYLKRNIDVSGLLLVFANFFTFRIIVNFLEFSSDFLFFRNIFPSFKDFLTFSKGEMLMVVR